MYQNVVKRGSDNPVILLFGLRGEFTQNGLNSFDFVDFTLGNEFYSTVNTPDELFINPDDPFELRLKIGNVTNLPPNLYVPTIKGFNLTYPNGYVLNSRELNLLKPIRVI